MTVNNDSSCSQETRNSLSQKHRWDHISDCGKAEAKHIHIPGLALHSPSEQLESVWERLSCQEQRRAKQMRR